MDTAYLLTRGLETQFECHLTFTFTWKRSWQWSWYGEIDNILMFQKIPIWKAPRKRRKLTAEATKYSSLARIYTHMVDCFDVMFGSAGVVVSTPDSPTAANYHEVGEFHYPGDQLDAPRVTLDQDILRPIFKVLGHCLMGPTSSPELRAAAVDAARALHVRASHALNPEAILASRSLLRLHAAALISSR
jgi:hypothetical protein